LFTIIIIKMKIKKSKIGLDIDGVLANFRIAWSTKYPNVDPKSTSWNFDNQIKERFESMIVEDTLDEFYLDIPPLLNPKDIPFDPCCYITARPIDSKITELWLSANGFPQKPVVTVGVNKSKVQAAKEHNIDIFIDDNYNNFKELNDNGICCYLYTAPWNERYDVGQMRINSLKDISIVW